MITIFTHIKFSRIYGPARNARKYVLRENFYVYSIYTYIYIYIYIYTYIYIYLDLDLGISRSRYI